MQYTLWQSSSQVGCHDASLVVSVRQFVLNVISKFSPFNECRTKAANSTFSHFMPVVFAQLICVFCLSLVQWMLIPLSTHYPISFFSYVCVRGLLTACITVLPFTAGKKEKPHRQWKTTPRIYLGKEATFTVSAHHQNGFLFLNSGRVVFCASVGWCRAQNNILSYFMLVVCTLSTFPFSRVFSLPIYLSTRCIQYYY
jgi:hypothetical protein